MESAALHIYGPEDTKYWNDKSSCVDCNCLFSTIPWITVLQKTYGFTPWRFELSPSNNVTSSISLLEVSSYLTGKRGVSLPFTDLYEPNCTDSSSFGKIFEAIKEFGIKRGWKYIELRGGGQYLHSQSASTRFYTHNLELTQPPEDIFKRFSSSTRRAIRKSERHSLTVTKSNSPDSVDILYQLLCKTRKRHGLPPQPSRFFRHIENEILKNEWGSIFTAHYQGKPIATALFLHNGYNSIYKFGASDLSHQNLRANNLVMWSAILWLINNGYRSLNFGRCSLHNHGLRKYKRSWGASESIAHYFRFDLVHNRFVQQKDESRGWHNRIFQILPIPVSKLVGTILYPHVA